MASVHVDDTAVTVVLSRVESWFCGGRSRLVVPLSEVRSVERVDRPTRASATGIGRAGLAVTGVVKLGRWGIGSPVNRFVSVRRWTPALRVVVGETYRPQLGYHEILVSVADPDRVLAQLPVSR
ncbi:hypothetical protein [Pseudonocardia sp. HH130630-07]|uniref:hypothetical protein n=1 Tax=Pseudonocardia sp. HH130630-07 TaxID=1690815 RepID=UPI000814E74D|nr:hypothetical protein [Pseudonocardia sp. HH130630-07]ANY09534.1 hypothetical protein AFB00_28530 [Pseudonocardia sp. HH130630-07]